jgi:hypothetical protein
VGGFLVGEDEGLRRFTLLVATPVRLEQDGIDQKKWETPIEMRAS